MGVKKKPFRLILSSLIVLTFFSLSLSFYVFAMLHDYDSLQEILLIVFFLLGTLEFYRQTHENENIYRGTTARGRENLVREK
jgi:hypothetical protein